MTLAYIPSPTISQFSIGPVTIHFYALCILLGIVLAVWMTTVHWKRYGGNFDQILDITLVAVPSGIIGARIYHIITTPERFFGPTGDWVEMFRIWNGGLGIWGGVLLGALAAWAWCRHKHYPMALLGDAVGRLQHGFLRRGALTRRLLPLRTHVDVARRALGFAAAVAVDSRD